MFGLAGTLRGHSCPTHATLLNILCLSLSDRAHDTTRLMSPCQGALRPSPGMGWRTALLPRLLADDGDVLPVLYNKILCFHHEHPDAPLQIGPL